MNNSLPRLKKLYEDKIISSLINEFNYSSVMEVPKLKKIVVHQGIGIFSSNKKDIEFFMNEITDITGQKSIFCYSKHDEAGFKLRKGMPIGVKVTLRRNNMYEFLERLIFIALPRVRDFNGVKNTSFDGSGNYNMGILEQIIYPEIDIDKIKKSIGMNITFVTSSKKDIETKRLLSLFGIPFMNKNNIKHG
ncbi:50S ribosomal protein L5 [Blattabacterium cuenoti]|uniref:50S ribosomal protein L5 n=1 Tax=Blattabacterium cuenoti TaxID=1653831 RepID=UPI00163B7506|nr:50S ribosomal protein L5 [Blattabacterium cuenoti]